MKPMVLGAAALAAMVVHQPARADTPSNYLRCDGQPDNVTGAETAARVLAVTALVGLLIPSNETADVRQRLAGEPGIAACTAVLATEGNAIRRAQLLLARAVHHLEVRHWDEAIADARRVGTDRPEFVVTRPFRLSMALSALEIEALAHLGAGRTREAADKGLEMATTAPFDVVNMLRAARYVAATGAFGPPEQAYYTNLIRVFPLALGDRAATRQTIGDWRGAAGDYDLLNSLVQSITGKPSPALLASRALALALGGDAETGDALARTAQTAVDAEVAAGRANSVTGARELLDFHRLLRMAQNGNADEARILFAARSSWAVPNAAAVSEVARLLQQGAPAARLTGLLAGDPGRFRAEALAARVTRFTTGEDAGKEYYRAIRPFVSQGSLDRFANNVWRQGRSRYFARNENPQMKARLVNVLRDGGGAAAGYAFLLHSALVARAEGKTHFMVLPAQSSPAIGFVRTGNLGDPGIFEPVAFEAEQVIRAIDNIIPRPARR